MASQLKQIYCKNCKRTTSHEDGGVDIKPTHRYVCIECLSCNPLPLRGSSETTTKLMIVEDFDEQEENQ
jgi:hypothetical protein